SVTLVTRFECSVTPCSPLFPYTTLFRSILRGQVANDDVGFPEHQLAVFQARHQLVRVLLGVVRLADDTEGATGIDAGVGNAKLFQAPERLLHVSGIGPAPELQHAISPACLHRNINSSLATVDRTGDA